MVQTPNALDGNRDTPSFKAAFKNNAGCVWALLEGEASVNALDYNNDTPLSWAAMKGNLESVSILLDYGAEVKCQPKRPDAHLPAWWLC